jgi:hypothetical protein
LRENNNCSYTSEAFNRDFHHRIRDLGPSPASWVLDAGTIELQLSAPKVITFQIGGTFKKIPETTIKQFIRDKWNCRPRTANPGILNCFYGVEVSCCTGNARRVPLKKLLIMENVQGLLERQIPGWRTTGWGQALTGAAMEESDDAIYEFWTRFSTYRHEVAKLVLAVLEVSESTGRKDDNFQVAFLYKNRELVWNIPLEGNEWARLLDDTHLSATYAITNDVCLECRLPDHSASICGKRRTRTVLQTVVGIKEGPTTSSRFRIEPSKKVLRRVGEDRPIVVELEDRLERTRRWVDPTATLSTICELFDQSRGLNHRRLDLVLRASRETYGGSVTLVRRGNPLMDMNWAAPTLPGIPDTTLRWPLPQWPREQTPLVALPRVTMGDVNPPPPVTGPLQHPRLPENSPPR